MMEDNDEDPIREWEKTYDSLDAWWAEFIEMDKRFWYYFHISNVNPEYRDKLSALALESLSQLEISPDSFFNKETLKRKWRLDERDSWR